MEQTILNPFTKENIPLPLTKEVILSINDGRVSFEEARALFNVDLLTFKARLEQLNIFVWKEGHGALLRIHGGDYVIRIVIKDMREYYAVKARNYYTVPSTFSFETVKSMIEKDLKLSPGCYKLTFKYPNKSVGNVWVKTDRDWHYVVLFSRLRGYFVYLDLEVFPSSQTADEDACDEDPWYEDPCYVEPSNEDEDDDDDASDEDASDVCDEDACDEKYVKNVFVEGACDENLMEKKAILSLNNGSVTFEQARAILNGKSDMQLISVTALCQRFYYLSVIHYAP